MPRNLSPEALRSMMDQYTSEVWLQLVTIASSPLPPPSGMEPAGLISRIVLNPKDVTYKGNLFRAAHWELNLVPSDPERLPVARFRFFASTRELIEEIRTLTTTIHVQHEIALQSLLEMPNHEEQGPEVGPIYYTLKDVQYSANAIEGTLGFEDTLGQTYPKDTFVPSKFPGLF